MAIVQVLGWSISAFHVSFVKQKLDNVVFMLIRSRKNLKYILHME